jgi:hypothetical protein
VPWSSTQVALIAVVIAALVVVGAVVRRRNREFVVQWNAHAACRICSLLRDRTECPEPLPTISSDRADAMDAWGRRFVCSRGPSGLRITSYGHDGEPGGVGWDKDVSCEPSERERFCFISFEG